jgi:nucleoside-diphosphate-sugar epimerase
MLMKLALVTGANGFVGRHVTRHLQMIGGWDVIGSDIRLENGTYNPTGDAHNLFRNVYSNIRYDLIVHCAYHVGGRKGIDGDNLNLVENLRLDAALFSWATVTNQPRVLYFSSSAIYPIDLQINPEDLVRLQEDECDPLYAQEPDGPYGFAKLAGERQAIAVNASSDTKVHIVRPFSGYGEDQSLDYPFPAFIKRTVEGQRPFEIWGNAQQVRDWIHIDDVVRGAFAVVDAEYTEPVNLCTGVDTSLEDLAVRMNWINFEQGHFDSLDYEDIKVVEGPMGVMNRVGDTSRMLEFYEPKVSLDEGIVRCLEAARA